MNFKKVVLLTTLALPSALFGQAEFPVKIFGDQVGNGGKSIVCRDSSNGIARSQLLDYYESEKLYGLHPVFISGTFMEKAQNAISRVNSYDPERHRMYQRLLEKFLANSKFVASPLMDTKDSDHIIAPPVGCGVEQVAIQMQPSFPNDRLYTINRDIWDSLDEDNKAGLVLHEIIYFEAISRGHKNSIAVRYFNANIASDAILQMTVENYLEMLKAAKFGTYYWRDDESGKTWTFLDSVEANWKKAKEACIQIIGATLPSADQLTVSAPTLLKSPLMDRVVETEIYESWSSTRRPEDGLVAVGMWSSAGIDIFYRNQSSDLANIICINN